MIPMSQISFSSASQNKTISAIFTVAITDVFSARRNPKEEEEINKTLLEK
jgi:hypothetical protein